MKGLNFSSNIAPEIALWTGRIIHNTLPKIYLQFHNCSSLYSAAKVWMAIIWTGRYVKNSNIFSKNYIIANKVYKILH